MTDEQEQNSDLAAPATGTPRATPRANALWVDADYATVVGGLRAGLTEVEIAQRLGRTTRGLRRRWRWLLPPDVDLPRAEIEDRLRATLTGDKDYDWRAALRCHHERTNRPYFDDLADKMLRQAWTARRALPEVAAALGGVDEFTIARQMIALGLAGSLVEVVEQLGATPGGVLDVRVRLAKERQGAAVWILIVDGLAIGRHVSVHDTGNDAQTQLTALLDRHADPEATLGQVSWTIAHRAVEGGNTGDTRHDKLLPQPGAQPPEEPQPAGLQWTVEDVKDD
jgi:hypothetical protein